jgi:hypothetical protein
MSKTGWKFLILDQSFGLVVRNMSSAYLAYEVSKPFSSYLVKPIPFSKQTARFFNEDINDKIMQFNAVSFKLEEYFEEPPSDFLNQRNLFILKLQYISKMNFYVLGRMFEISNTDFPEADLILKRELEKLEICENYSSKLLEEYAENICQPLDRVIAELRMFKEEQELRIIRATGKLKKFIRAINLTDNVEEMEAIYQTFLSDWTLDRIQ